MYAIEMIVEIGSQLSTARSVHLNVRVLLLQKNIEIEISDVVVIRVSIIDFFKVIRTP